MDALTRHIRLFEKGDELLLRDVFHTSIHTPAAADHSIEQLDAWSPESSDPELEARWVERMRSICPYIVEVCGNDGCEIAAYADVQSNGYIDHFFVAGKFGRRGIGTHLMNHLLDVARERGVTVLTSDVSKTAQSFFHRFGFVVVERQKVELRGVEFSSARMRLELA